MKLYSCTTTAKPGVLQLAAVSNLTSAFTEMQSYSHYHPSKGYWWQFRNQQEQTEQQKKEKEKVINIVFTVSTGHCLCSKHQASQKDEGEELAIIRVPKCI